MDLYARVNILDRKAVRLPTGDVTEAIALDADPIERARGWVAKGADRLHIVDLDAAAYGDYENRPLIEDLIAAVEVPVQVAGGIRTPAEVERILGFGAWRVVMGTAAIDDQVMIWDVCRDHPDKLAVTGWSYGGMLTNHVITKTERFKAAATGASSTLYVVNFGHDQYQRWWRYELGLPWEPASRQLYDKLSPFNRVEKITTPTLILGGKEDWNVPIINSEQLYFALKLLGVPTELVVYPDEFHGIDTPSHAKDLYERYLVWFGRYLKGEKTAKAH